MSIQTFLTYFINVDEYLVFLISLYGVWIYPILFIVIFCETGLVVFPFLPGDSLIFVAGTIAAQQLLNVWLLYILLVAGAILGDSLNYWIGRKLGPKVFSSETSKFFNKNNLIKANNFYEKHGGKTIIYARFIPVLRTFAPFVAGIGKMTYIRFFAYNIVGGILWVSLALFGGYYFGQIPIIKNNLTLVVIVIIITSLIPAIVEYIKHRIRKIEVI
ncbi:MAG: DedA family protein [Candidatus Nanoarchaeia archaeon]|nr:DedA family protein [Candidatus Nanoarchaeia archaeon]MDD5740452.1 DedA family protein [Candidatus Nanoarchaeia archaeon]